jgi:hypothetical protein
MAALATDESLTQEQLARQFGVSRTTIVGDMHARGIHRQPWRQREGEIAPGRVSESTIHEVYLYKKGAADRRWQLKKPLSPTFAGYLPQTGQTDNTVEAGASNATSQRAKRRSIQRSWPIQTGTGWRPQEPLSSTFAGYLPERLQTGTREIKKKR